MGVRAGVTSLGRGVRTVLIGIMTRNILIADTFLTPTTPTKAHPEVSAFTSPSSSLSVTAVCLPGPTSDRLCTHSGEVFIRED